MEAAGWSETPVRIRSQDIITYVAYCKLWSERENQQDATIICLLSTLSQHVSGIIMPICRRTKTVCHCMCCATLVLLDVVGSGCGAQRSRFTVTETYSLLYFTVKGVVSVGVGALPSVVCWLNPLRLTEILSSSAGSLLCALCWECEKW